MNYADFKLRCISASILGLEEFDEAEFERQIEEIAALEDGSLEYHFREGRTQTWQKCDNDTGHTQPLHGGQNNVGGTS